MNIMVDKYPRTNTVKILHERFFFQSKACYVNHALSFYLYQFVDGSSFLSG